MARPVSRTAPRAFIRSKVMISDTWSAPYFSTTYSLTRCRPSMQKSISKSGILGWRSKYIEVVFDSLLTKSFPRVVRAVQNEPGISLLESINRTSTLLESSLINALYEDFGVLKEIIGDPQIDLVVPASLWIDYLSVQKQ